MPRRAFHSSRCACWNTSKEKLLAGCSGYYLKDSCQILPRCHPARQSVQLLMELGCHTSHVKPFAEAPLIPKCLRITDSGPAQRRDRPILDGQTHLWMESSGIIESQSRPLCQNEQHEASERKCRRKKNNRRRVVLKRLWTRAL